MIEKASVSSFLVYAYPESVFTKAEVPVLA